MENAFNASACDGCGCVTDSIMVRKNVKVASSMDGPTTGLAEGFGGTQAKVTGGQPPNGALPKTIVALRKDIALDMFVAASNFHVVGMEIKSCLGTDTDRGYMQFTK